MTTAPTGTSIAPIDAAELGRRRERIQAELRSRGLAAAVLTERANFEYVTAYWQPPLWSSYTRLLAAIVPAEGEPLLVLPSFIAGGAEDLGFRVEAYATLEKGAGELLASALRGAGLANERIAVERGRETRLAMAVDELERLRGSLGQGTVEDVADAIWAARSIKSRPEIDRLRIACAANAAAHAAGYGQPRAGQTERDVAAEMLAAGTRDVAAHGTWTVPGWIGITSGPGGYTRFVSGPRDRRLEQGDMLWADIGFTSDGYWSDTCRAAVVGGPSTQQVDRQRRIVEATNRGIELLRPGKPIAEVAATMRRVSNELGLAGLGFGRLGHGIGLTATEPPSVVEHDPTILEAGMVITTEPAAVHEDGLYCAEQLVVVGDPPELLSPDSTDLRTI